MARIDPFVEEQDDTQTRPETPQPDGMEIAVDGEQPRPGSLRERMARRDEELRKRTYELFPVPMWDQFVAVQLKAISWTTSQAAVEANSRVPQMTHLYTAGDEIVKATVAFVEIPEDGNIKLDENGDVHPDALIDDAHTWYELATRLGRRSLPIQSERVALISMCTDQGAVALNTQYRRWLGGANTGLLEALRQDF